MNNELRYLVINTDSGHYIMREMDFKISDFIDEDGYLIYDIYDLKEKSYLTQEQRWVKVPEYKKEDA